MHRLLNNIFRFICFLFISFSVCAYSANSKSDYNNLSKSTSNFELDPSFELPYEEREDVRIKTLELETFINIQSLIRDYLENKDLDSFKEELKKIGYDEEHESMFFQGFSDIFYKAVIKELTGSNILLYKKNAIFPFSSFKIATLNDSHPQSFGTLTLFASSIWERIRQSYFPDRSMERHQSKFDRALLGPVYIVDKNTLFIVVSMIMFTSFDSIVLLNIEKEEMVSRIIRKFK